MKVITTYMADDGAIFATEKECKEYEEKKTEPFHKKYKINVLFFDGVGNQLSGTFDFLMNHCCYIYINSREDLKQLVEINNNNNNYHYQLPECEGLWSYNFALDEYENYKEKIEEYQKEIEIFENIDYHINKYFLLMN